MIGTLANRTKFPKGLIGEYTSYSVVANEEGYNIIIEHMTLEY